MHWHCRTPLVNFLAPPDPFLDALGARVVRVETSELVAEGVLGSREEPTVALLSPPGV